MRTWGWVPAVCVAVAFIGGPLQANDDEDGDFDRAGSKVELLSCIYDMTGSIASRVSRLSFRKRCQPEGKDPVIYVWEYLYKGRRYSNNRYPSESVADCSADLATSLNKSIPGLDISVQHRCQKKSPTQGGSKAYFWRYHYQEVSP